MGGNGCGKSRNAKTVNRKRGLNYRKEKAENGEDGGRMQKQKIGVEEGGEIGGKVRKGGRMLKKKREGRRDRSETKTK